MPRFVFHTEDGRCFPDENGIELADVETAKVEAVAVLGELLKEDARNFWNTESFRLTVVDENDLTRFILDTSAVTSPSAAPGPKA